MKYDIVKMLPRLLLPKVKYHPFFFIHKTRQEQCLYVKLYVNACMLSYFVGADMQVLLGRFLLPPVIISHIFSPFFGEEHAERVCVC